MKFLIIALLCVAGPVFAASINFSGSLRADTGHFSDLALGAPGTAGPKSYFGARALLQPNLIIDDHFSLQSQWSLLASPGTSNRPSTSTSPMTPPANVALGPGQGGFIWGDTSSVGLILSRVWLQWTSDFGVLRLGRMPVSWGYGLIYDAGDKTWDNWQSTLDRFDYRLHLGNVVGGVAYSRPFATSVLRGVNVHEYYSVYLKYENPESEVEAGILYELQNRKGNPNINPLSVGMSPAIAGTTPFPSTNNLVDLYIKKTVRYFSFGGELAWAGGDAFDGNGDNAADSLSSFSVLLNAAYETSSLKAFLDFMYVSGDGNYADGSFSGFALLNRNRHAGLIMGQELMGALHVSDGNSVGLGGLFAYGGANVFSGVYLIRPGVRIDWSQNWSSGIEVIWARMVEGANKNLGLEVDLGLEHQVYKNCAFGLNAGYLFAGSALGNGGVFLAKGTLGVTF